jgi:quinol monooxygenase YgiN
MIICNVTATFSENEMQTALSILADETSKIAALPGNLAIQTFVSPITSGRVLITHEWDDLDALEAYRTGPILADTGAKLKPIMTSPPVTKVYEATLLA